MKIQSLHINNYKSLIDVEIKNPQPFSVFVGANASGKSNIFQSLEFSRLLATRIYPVDVLSLFEEGPEKLMNQKLYEDYLRSNEKLSSSFFSGISIERKNELNVNSNTVKNEIEIEYVLANAEKEVKKSKLEFSFSIMANDTYRRNFNFNYLDYFSANKRDGFKHGYVSDYDPFSDTPPLQNFSRIFINDNSQREAIKGGSKLSSSCDNLEQVLKRILKDEAKKEEIVEWLQLLVPGFDNIEIHSTDLKDEDYLRIYEKGTDKPFPKHLISDGTFNIIALLTAVYQSDEPQFLCIEEPENGLNPKVVKELVGFFREQCKKNGHYIWLNTHSQTLVRELTTEEIILVDKIDGETRIKQIQGENLYGLPMDEALLTNAIGGGIPW